MWYKYYSEPYLDFTKKKINLECMGCHMNILQSPEINVYSFIFTNLFFFLRGRSQMSCEYSGELLLDLKLKMYP